MKEVNREYVKCAHCAEKVPSDKVIQYENTLIYGKHFHCRNCDPDGDWDCLSHDLDDDLH